MGIKIVLGSFFKKEYNDVGENFSSSILIYWKSIYESEE